MGGSVRVVIRKENGSIQAMTRWTNSLSYLIHTSDCFKSTDTESFQQYMTAFYDMQKDYEKHKKDRKFEHPMTSMYFYDGSDTLTPEEYGIVVMDYQTRTLISCQGYTGPNAFMFVKKADTENGFIYLPQYGFSTYNENQLKYHLSNGDILSFSYYVNGEKDKQVISLLGVNTVEKFSHRLTAFFEQLKASGEYEDDSVFERLPITLTFNRHGFNVFFYDEPHILKAKNKMEELGFVIPELKEWYLNEES